MYLGISIAFAAAACAAAVIQARKAHNLRRTLTSTEEQLLAFEKSAKCMEAALKTVTAEKEFAVERANKLDKAFHDGENAACTLRRSLQEARAELRLEKDEHERATKELSAAKREIETLKSDRHALEDALIREKETSEHWKSEHDKEYYVRLTTEGRVAREINNILNYSGSGRGQEDLYADEY